MLQAAAAALWSIAFKSVQLKQSAGEAGAFLLLAQAARAHRTDVEVLPHVFIAISNLAVKPDAGRAVVSPPRRTPL